MTVDPREVLDRPAAGPEFVLRYGDHPDAVIDLFLPPDPTHGRAPLAVVLHGGFWRAEYDRAHLRPLVWGLVAEGFAVATPEYRRGPGSWSAMSADVEAALAVVRGLIDAATTLRVDTESPFVLAGHSAGGQLALWAGQRAGPGVVSRIVALAPVTDLAYAARTGMGGDAAQALLAAEPDQAPLAYAAADAVSALQGGVPVTLVQGDADQQVPVAMNRGLATSLPIRPGTASFRYVELPGIDHFALIDPLSDAWPTVLRAIATHQA